MELARFRHRAFALIFDEFVALIPSLLIAVLIFALALNKISDQLIIIVTAVFAVTFDFLNRVILAKVTNGQSIGKWLFNLRIIGVDHKKPTFTNIFTHWLIIVLLDFTGSLLVYLINYLTMRKNPLKQGIHNYLADTIVVRSQTNKNKKLIFLLLSVIILCNIIILCSVTLATIYSNNLLSLIEIL